MDVENIRDAIIERSTVDDYGCWLWLGRSGPEKTWLIIDGRSQRAHRASYKAFMGDIPSGWSVENVCLEDRCVNPRHLRLLAPSEIRRRHRRFAII